MLKGSRIITVNSRLFLFFGVFNILFFAVALFWYFFDGQYTINSTQVKAANVFELTYYSARRQYFEKSLEKILATEDREKQTQQLAEYYEAVPVSHFYDPLYVQKVQVADKLLQTYKIDGRWQKVIDLAMENREINDGREARYPYYAGLGYEHKKEPETAKQMYYEALSIDAAHEDTLKRLLPMLLAEGEYYQADEILKAYRAIAKIHSQEVCFHFSGEGERRAEEVCPDVQLGEEGVSTKMTIEGDALYYLDTINGIGFEPAEGVFQIRDFTVELISGETMEFNDWNIVNDIESIQQKRYKTIGTEPKMDVTLKGEINVDDIQAIRIDIQYSEYFDADPAAVDSVEAYVNKIQSKTL